MSEILERVVFSGTQRWNFTHIMMSDEVEELLQEIGDEIASRAGPEYVADVLPHSEEETKVAYVWVPKDAPSSVRIRARKRQQKHRVLEKALYGR